MDIGSFYSLSTERDLASSHSPKTDKAKTKSKIVSKVKPSADLEVARRSMVDNKGWRKKIAAKPKDLPRIKTGSDDTATARLPEVPAAVDPTDRRRHGWRKTMAASRPATPLTPASPTPTPDDIEDTRSELSRGSTPRRDSKPKLIRYTSLFATHKEVTTNGPDFAEPWSIEAPPEHDAWVHVDPIVAMESIHSHLCKNHRVPVPLEYNSGLFRIFDDYRKLRSHRDHLREREQEVLEDSRRMSAQWLKSEACYEAEIRRLQLLIAQGTAGITGLMTARQGTVVDRKHQHRKTISTGRCFARYQYMFSSEITDEVKRNSQQVRVHRPDSSSGTTTAIPQQYTLASPSDAPIGYLLDSERDSALSRKVKSELSLTDLRNVDPLRSLTSAVTLDTSQVVKSLLDRRLAMTDMLAEDTMECDALVALKELCSLVACRKGLDVPCFVNGVMGLIDTGHAKKSESGASVHTDETGVHETQEDEKMPINDLTPRPPLRETSSWLRQRPDQKRRRHFSFETGDDMERQLEAESSLFGSLPKSQSTGSQWSSALDFPTFAQCSSADHDSGPLLASLGEDLPKPSMIPSPVQTVGRVRRESSMSSLQSVFIKNIQDDRHNSRTSIQTAFREASSASASIKSKSRNSSSHNLQAAESSLERRNSLAHRHSTTALVAARVAEARSNSLSRSNTRLATATASSRKLHTGGQDMFENKDPKPHNNAGRKEAK